MMYSDAARELRLASMQEYSPRALSCGDDVIDQKDNVAH